MAMQFDFVDLRLFSYVAEEKSLTRAAARVFISLPAASMRIKNLEQSIGVPLLNRSAQGITLRPAGETFLAHARQVLQQVELLRSDLQEYAQGIKGSVSLQANTTAMTEFLPHVLSQYLAQWPDINVDLRERPSDDIVRAVLSGATDVGIVAGSVNTEGLQVLPYRQDKLVLVVAPEHPLAEHDVVAFEDTIDSSYIMLHEGTAIYSFLKRVTDSMSRPLQTRIQVGSFEAACRMVAANAGISLIPESVAKRHATVLPIRIVGLTNEWAIRDLLICVRDVESLPSFTHELIQLLLADADAIPVSAIEPTPE
ncbi:LysR family transcriptional regulator [Alcaligenaceae bacterium 429]|nr:LysR family transcriptional regulator [Alcaligenaceae bacterium 429]